MKHLIYIISAAALVCITSVSCEKYLDQAPDENLSIADVFSNRIYTRDFLTHTYSWTPTEANMADDGGSTGQLRDELGSPAGGRAAMRKI